MIKSSKENTITLESFGVNVSVAINEPVLMNAFRSTIDSVLVRKYKLRSRNSAEHEFSLLRNKLRRFDIFKNGNLEYTDLTKSSAIARLASDLRLTIAEYAVDRVFIHAGAVSWRGRGIVIPARSFKGKSSLTAALVKLGAKYYSDEYAILDSEGSLHSFAKDISLRNRKNGFEQTDHSIESIGGKAGKRAVPVKLVVVTEFKESAKWRPIVMENARGILELMNNAVAIRRAPHLVLPVLAKAASTAKFVKSKRGDADEAAIRILELLDEIKD